MAWQSPSDMAGNGGMGPGSMDGGSNGGQTQGTEYTLQGVMRFLQSEWHRHERDRNAWDIERAEMRSRIGKLEGDARTSKHMQDSLGKHVKLLETALKKEREKVKQMANGQHVDLGKDPKEAAKEQLNDVTKQHPKPLVTSIDVGNEEDEDRDSQSEADRDKSRGYLGKCSQEVYYHVIPGSQPQLDLNESQEMLNMAQRMQPQSLEEAYAQRQQQEQQEEQRQQQQQQRPSQKHPQQNHVGMVHEQPSQQANAPDYHEGGPNDEASRALEKSSLDQQQAQIGAADTRRTNVTDVTPNDVPPDADRQSYDPFGHQAPKKENTGHPIAPDEILVDEADGWNFDERPMIDTAVGWDPSRRPDTDAFPNANFVASKSPPRPNVGSHRRKSSGARRRSEGNQDVREISGLAGQKSDAANFKVRFALRGHLDVVRSVIFTGGGSPSEPEICTCGDDGTIKRWIIPATYGAFGPGSTPSGNDLDVTSYFTHRGHSGSVTCLASCPPSQNFSSGGRALGDGWVFSGGQDASVKVWERGRVDPKASLDGHTDAVWALCVLPGTSGTVFGEKSSHYGSADRILLASGASDGRVLIWSVSAPPQVSSPQTGSRRTGGGSRRANSVSSGSNFPSSPQPNTATSTPFHYTLVHHIMRPDSPSPTCISPLSLAGVNFVVSYTDASILVYDTRTGEEIVGMASLETYDGTRSTGVNSVVATTIGFDGTANLDPNRALAEDEAVVHGATGSSGGVEGVIISGYEDRFIRFFDANSGQCTYTMLAHPSAISSLSLSPDSRELVSAGHDASLRFWSLEKRSCTQEITSHRLMRGEGVCSVVWSQDGRWVVSGGGDGVVKVFAR